MAADNTQNVIAALEEFRKLLDKQDLKALNQLIGAYRGIYGRLKVQIDALILEIANKQPTPAQLVKMARYKALITQTAEELQGFQALTRLQLEDVTRLGIALGEQHTRELISITATGTPQISGMFNVLPTETIEALLGFLAPDGALYQRLSQLYKFRTQEIADALVQGVALGYNPVKIANQIFRAKLGVALTDALRMVRTAQIWSYREASRASMIANGDVVEGWIWYSALDQRVCLSCVALHGSIHTNQERLNDHYNGRCTQVPLVRGFGALLQEGEGQRWFEGLSESEQRKMMGNTRYEAWKAGKFDFTRLTDEHDDPIYGPMKGERTLKDLLGIQ